MLSAWGLIPHITLLHNSFSLLKSRDKVSTQVQKKLLKGSSCKNLEMPSTLQFRHSPDKLWVSSSHDLKGWLQRWRDLHDQIRSLRRQVNSLVIRSCRLGMLPGVLGWNQSRTTGGSEPGATAQPQPRTLSSGWRWVVWGPESLTGWSARAGKVPYWNALCVSAIKRPWNSVLQGKAVPLPATLGEGVLPSLSPSSV